jgi:hypothetical protein
MAGALLPVLAAAGTLWLAAWLAYPRRPRGGDEVAELVCARLLGQRDRLLLLALLATALLGTCALIAALAGATGRGGALPLP